MCTATWQNNKDHLSFWFNRDELHTRKPAFKPVIFSSKLKYIAPVDADSGGSWLAVNEAGLIIALLNRYDPFEPETPLSRGNLVVESAQFDTIQETVNYLNSIDLKNFKPFQLLILGTNNTDAGILQKKILNWNGIKVTEQTTQVNMLTSSSVDFDRTAIHRFDLFKQYSCIRDFHASHEPEKSYRSVCMHRNDASTVSVSHIEAGQNKVRFTYFEGPLCENPGTTVLEMPVQNRRDRTYA